MTAAPVNEVDMTLLTASLSHFRNVVKAIGLIIAGTILNLDAGFDTKENRKAVWNCKLKPNIKENPRNRKYAKRGRKRFFNEDIYKLRFIVERTFAWEDKFKRLLIRFERIHQRHMGFHFMAFTFINLREFCVC
jgi:transposase